MPYRIREREISCSNKPNQQCLTGAGLVAGTIFYRRWDCRNLHNNCPNHISACEGLARCVTLPLVVTLDGITCKGTTDESNNGQAYRRTT